METQTPKTNTVTFNLMTSGLFLIIGLRFNAQDDLIGTMIYSVATVLFLLRAGILYLKGARVSRT
jgi:multisubunit Na+/H+ antiporter MnhC subunit